MAAQKVVIVGGGYAGLTVGMALKSSDITFDVVLIDPKSEHLKLTHLHKTVHKPLAQYTSRFAELAARHGFRFIQAEADPLPEDLTVLCSQRSLTVQSSGRSQVVDFDYLVLASGARSVKLSKDEKFTVDLEQLKAEGARKFLDRALAKVSGQFDATIVGGGPTAIQFLFEIKDYLKKAARPHQLRLIDRNEQLVDDLPDAFHDYVVKQLVKQDIEYLPQTNYTNQTETRVHFQDVQSGEDSDLHSDLTFLFPGVRSYPTELNTNANGLLKIKDTLNRHIFAAGDVSNFSGSGLNMKSAQAAVRKGKQVAQNIIRSAAGRRLGEYKYNQLGYFVSLGSMDGIGWIFSKSNVVTGIPAFFIKEAIEAQFELYLQGFDTYVI